MVHHHASLVVRAGRTAPTVGKARIYATAIEAGHVRGATIVAEAFTLFRSAHQLATVIHDETVRTDATGPMTARDTFLVGVAYERCRYRARIAALPAGVAAQAFMAVAVCLACHRNNLRVIRSWGGHFFAFGIRFAFDVRSSDVAVRA